VISIVCIILSTIPNFTTTSSSTSSTSSGSSSAKLLSNLKAPGNQTLSGGTSGTSGSTSGSTGNVAPPNPYIYFFCL
jgi:hypothetical protein